MHAILNYLVHDIILDMVIAFLSHYQLNMFQYHIIG